MKKELFKELNAHVRACDNKALTLSAAYLGGLVFANSTKADDRILGLAFSNLGFNLADYHSLVLVTFILTGYMVLFAQLWFRFWKVQYLNILHSMWLEHQTEFGENVPTWMKESTPLMTWDNFFRSIPFFVNLLLVVNLASTLTQGTENYWTLFVFFITGHFLVSFGLLKAVSTEKVFGA